MMDPPYHPQPHNDDDGGHPDDNDNNVGNIIAATSSFDSFEQQQQQQQQETMPKPRISPRAQRRISPWAMDLQLKRGGPSNPSRASSKTERSTSSWKLRMQQRKAVYGGVAVAEEEQEEEEDANTLEQPALDHGPTPQQKALKYIQEQRNQKHQLQAREQQQQQQPQESKDDGDGLGALVEDSILEEEEDEEDYNEEEQQARPNDTTVEEENREHDHDVDDEYEYEGLSELEILRKQVLKELKEALRNLYIGDQHIVESLSMRDLTEEELLERRNRHNKRTSMEEEHQKQVVMKDLAQRVSGIYTQDHHVVEAMSKLEQIINEEDEKEGNEEGKDDEIGQTDTSQVPTLSLQQQQQQPQQTFMDLPRANFHFTSSAASSQDGDDDDDDDEISVFTEVTIEDMVQTAVVVPNKDDESGDVKEQTAAFKDQMRKSFLAFEQLVHAKHEMEHNDDYDEETVFEEYSIVHDDSKTVMTEMTTEELIEQVVVKSAISTTTTTSSLLALPTLPTATTTTETPSKVDTLENFQSEMRKSFAAFEALLGDDEFDEAATIATNTVADGETTVLDEASFDEFTVEETTVHTTTTTTPTVPQQPSLPQDGSYDEVTVAESIIAELAGVVQESPKRKIVAAPAKTVVVGTNQQNQQQHPQQHQDRKEEKIKQFQNEMKKSFTAFESLLLKQKEDGDNDDDDDESSGGASDDEYTVEEVIDQVTAGDDSKLFAKEMQKSFLAFESLLKQTTTTPVRSAKEEEVEDESVWEEETVQETVQGSTIAPSSIATPKIAAYHNNNNSTSAAAVAALLQSPNRSVASSKASAQSGKTYEDAISLVGGEASTRASGTKYDDAIPVLDAEQEEKTRTGPSPMSPSRLSYQGEEEQEGEEKKDESGILQNTNQFLNVIGGNNDDKGDNTETTEQETLSGETKPETSMPNSLSSSSPSKKRTGPVLVLTKPEPKTPSPTKKFTHQQQQQQQQRDLPSETNNALTNSRMFSDIGLVLSDTKKSKVKTPQKNHNNHPIMDVEFSDGDYDDDDDMTQITFDHTMHETPQKQRPPPKEEEVSPGGGGLQDETGSTCSSQASKGIAEMLRRDIWSPDLLVVQTALEKLGMEAVKGRSYRSHIVKFGGLLGILRAMDMNPNHSGIQLAACQALERLALDPETQMSIGGVGGIPVVATAMQNNTTNLEIQRAATAALVNISCCPQDNIEGALESVILSMTKHANDTEVQENSFKVLANLTMDSPGRLKELSHRGGLAAMTMALQKPWSIKAEHHEAISLLSMLLRNLAECNQ